MGHQPFRSGCDTQRVALYWNREVIENPAFAWVGYLVCTDCGETWRGLLPNERPGVFGPVLEQCPDCENDEWNAGLLGD